VGGLKAKDIWDMYHADAIQAAQSIVSAVRRMEYDVVWRPNDTLEQEIATGQREMEQALDRMRKLMSMVIDHTLRAGEEGEQQ
jgi:hypothetical protein